MSVTHNKFKNIETRVFSPEIYDLNKEQLLGLKKELNQTYNDAKQNNQILERWNIVDAKLSQLITNISHKPNVVKWLTEHLWLPILMVIIAAAIAIYYDQYKLQDNKQTTPVNKSKK